MCVRCDLPTEDVILSLMTCCQSLTSRYVDLHAVTCQVLSCSVNSQGLSRISSDISIEVSIGSFLLVQCVLSERRVSRIAYLCRQKPSTFHPDIRSWFLISSCFITSYSFTKGFCKKKVYYFCFNSLKPSGSYWPSRFNMTFRVLSEECSSGFIRISEAVLIFNIFIPPVPCVVLRMKGYYLQFIALTDLFL